MTKNRLPPLVRPLDSFDRQELIDTLADVLETLYLDCDAAGRFVWIPDREWDACTVDDVAAVLHRYGLILKPDSDNSATQCVSRGRQLV